MPEPVKCSKCPAMVIFMRFAKTGNLAPINAEPDPKGYIAIVDGLLYKETKDMFEPLPPGPRYLSHFVTCPFSKEFRRSDQKKKK